MSTLRVGAVPLSRSALPLVAALVALAAIGWLVTGNRMSGMNAGPGIDPGALGFFLVTWVVMMGAMMFPSVAPMVVAYDRISAHRREIGRPAAPARAAPLLRGALGGGGAVGPGGRGPPAAAPRPLLARPSRRQP